MGPQIVKPTDRPSINSNNLHQVKISQEAKAQAQFHLCNDLEKQVVVAKFFNSTGSETWYLINQDTNDSDYCWGICHIFEWKVGSFSKSEIENFRGKFGLGIERDLHFEEVNAKELFEKLLNTVY
jgi:hypothetical protein